MGQAPDNLLFIFECPYCATKHKFEGYDYNHYYEYEIKWSDYSQINYVELSNCASCNKAFTFHAAKPVRRADKDVKKSYKMCEARLLDCIVNRYSSTGEADEAVQHTIVPHAAREVLRSENYPTELEMELRLMVWWEYNREVRPHQLKMHEPWNKMRRQLGLFLNKVSNLKQQRLLRKAKEDNLKHLLKLNPEDIFKLEIYRNLGMFEEARQLFDKTYFHMAYDAGDLYFWTFYYELKKRLKKKDKKIFGLMPTFKIV